ncbi:ATP-binding cassette domain-containing protein [Shewanella eurypsychrophilus]|uniref:ATP-binding cassette domain-containing protein n=1 Tax=Shewanella eurypsychrophilus TaxID=2593656 RepID=A0ABX8S2R0_9GAMM|nr:MULTISPECIES: ATP-binding cassette domain-containing protein [Shewanella]QFU23240.1 ATP-binding cassette domain-containing protein [Shewanella sp. YLB-09]QXP44833.1 ATP-binding cassette domain-containing protein [Shewanella eurypsychrophilus]
MITLENLTLKYEDKLAINQLSLSIKTGEKVAIIGTSGAGKSTLLAHLYKMLKDNASYCSQKQGLVDSLSTYHNVYMGALARHHWVYNLVNLISPFKQPFNDVAKICEILELDFPISKKLSELSGGQRQRVALGRALYQEQAVFIGDEPFSALDPNMAKRLLDVVFSRHETVIMVLHDKSSALAHFDRVIGLSQGNVILDLPKLEITSAAIDKLYAGSPISNDPCHALNHV